MVVNYHHLYIDKLPLKWLEKNLKQKFTYNDRWSRNKSIKMFHIYCKHYNLTTAEEIARCWNGGPNGLYNPITANYWKKVQKNLDS